MNVGTVKLQFESKDIELTIDEARLAYEELCKLFGAVPLRYFHTPPVIIPEPLPRPNWRPFEPYCGPDSGVPPLVAPGSICIDMRDSSYPT